MQLGDIGGQRRQPRRAHLAGIGIDQQRRADLDDDTAEFFECGRAISVQSNGATFNRQAC